MSVRFDDDNEKSIRKAISLPNLERLTSMSHSNLATSPFYEPINFLLWILAFLYFVVMIPTIFACFFAFVVESQHRNYALVGWVVFMIGFYYHRQYVINRAPPIMLPILYGGEIFIVAAMFCTICANLAFVMHTPGPPLFDLGFYFVPEQAVDSPWRPISDTLTVAAPLIMVACGVVFEKRKTRCEYFEDWFRLISVAYVFRAITFVVTSLPGPAPHCHRGPNYNPPPEEWWEVMTKLGPMYGQFNTCGDLLFSGHASWSTATLLLLDRMTARFPLRSLRRALMTVYLFTMCTLALAGRKHYSVDLVLGVIMGFLVFSRFQYSWWGGPRVAREPPGARRGAASRGKTEDEDEDEGGGGGGDNCGVSGGGSSPALRRSGSSSAGSAAGLQGTMADQWGSERGERAHVSLQMAALHNAAGMRGGGCGGSGGGEGAEEGKAANPRSSYDEETGLAADRFQDERESLLA